VDTSSTRERLLEVVASRLGLPPGPTRRAHGHDGSAT
jgi:hypothetical protein